MVFWSWASQCGRLIPQWSQDCLEACCVWSLSGHFNISPSSRIGPHVAPAITKGSPLSFFLLPSAGHSHPAAVCHSVVSPKLLSTPQIPRTFVFRFAFYSEAKHSKYVNILHRNPMYYSSKHCVFTDAQWFGCELLTLNPSSAFSAISLSTPCLLYHWSAGTPSSCLCFFV